MAVSDLHVLTAEDLDAISGRNAPHPPRDPGGITIAAWLPTGQFHRLFPGILVYDRPGERRYFVPRGSVIWNKTPKGWTSWVTRAPAYKRFLADKWWAETANQDPLAGRYYDISSPPRFRDDGVTYVDLYLDLEKRQSRTTLLDEDEWHAFLKQHAVDPELVAQVEAAVREARQYGPRTWRAYIDRMEGECRRWVRDYIRDELAAAGIEPSAKSPPKPVLLQVLDHLEARTGAQVRISQVERVGAAELGRTLFTLITDPRGNARTPRLRSPRPPRRVPS